KLTIAATPRDKDIEPGGETMVDVELRDAAGKPAQNAEVAMVVVDESVLALTGYKFADPLDTFYFQRGDDVRNHHLREHVQLAKADGLISQVMQESRGAGGGVSGENFSMLPAPSPMADAAARPTSEFEAKKKMLEVGSLSAASLGIFDSDE